MPDQRLQQLESELAAARATIAELTAANAGLVTELANAELSLKRSRRTARQDGNTLREQITTLQSRRG